MQATGGVGDQNIDATGLGGLHGIEDDRSRIRACVLGNDRDFVALTPDLQLLHRRRTEGVTGGEHDFLAFQLQFLRQFADGRGFAGTVDAHHQDHERLVLRGDFQRLFDRLEHRRQFGLQGLVEGVGIGQLFARDLLRQALDDHRSGLYPNVGGQQTGFQVIEQFVIDGFLAQEQAGHAFADAGTGLGQALLESGKKTGFGFFAAYRLDRNFNRGNGHRLDDRCRCRFGLRHLDNRCHRFRDRFNDRCDNRHWLRGKGTWSRNRRRYMGRQLVFDQRHRLFRHGQGQPGFCGRGQRQFGNDLRFRFDGRLQHRLGDWQDDRR